MTKPPCTADPQKWDLAFGSFVDWDNARNDCLLRCPMLVACRAQLAALPKRDQPKGVVWGGKAYGERGLILDTDGMKGRSDRRRKVLPTTTDDDDQSPAVDSHGTRIGRSAA